MCLPVLRALTSNALDDPDGYLKRAMTQLVTALIFSETAFLCHRPVRSNAIDRRASRVTAVVASVQPDKCSFLQRELTRSRPFRKVTAGRSQKFGWEDRLAGIPLAVIEDEWWRDWREKRLCAQNIGNKLIARTPIKVIERRLV